MSKWQSAYRMAWALAAVGTAAWLVACGGDREDPRVQAVDTGISRDSAIALITGGQSSASADTFANVHRRSRFLVRGKEMEVLWFTPTGQVAGRDTIPFRDLTPIVLFDGRVIGKGWDFWEKTAGENNIAVPPRDTTR